MSSVYSRPLARMIFSLLAVPSLALATNGMNLEGYGPIALGSGGASLAYDNGTAALMNNPATLGLMSSSARLDLALGFLGPDVKSGTMSSSADSFYMPAFGYARRHGDLTFGFGVFGQGGMGAEYSQGVYVTSVKERSEVSVGRAMIPIVYDVNEQVKIGGSLDYVWAGMDLQMAMPGTQFFQMAGSGLISGTLLSAFNPMLGAPYGGSGPINSVNYGYFDFSDSNAFTGKASGSGYAEKLGVILKPSNKLTIGLTYHSKTSLGDLKASGAAMSMSVTGDFDANAITPDTTMSMPLKGSYAVKDFQWPETYGMGVAIQASENLMLAADMKVIAWHDVMKDFNMVFTADQSASNNPGGGFPDFRGTSLDATLPQNWKNQKVFSLGGAYRMSDSVTVRAGTNISSNPVPDSTVNYLFPATIAKHTTLGVGYGLSKDQTIDFALSKASEEKVKDAAGTTITHSQLSWQLMYSKLF